MSNYDIPLRKVAVSAFLIAETEVTNEQYFQFIKETNHKAPPDWKDGAYANGKANEPVVLVTWQEAADYCQWLSQKIGAEVRLPSEAEWELAARGKDNFRYPWGNDWDERAATSAETNGQIRPVKSYPQGRSGVGAFDLAGNVWEWVQDEALDTDGNPIRKDGLTYRVAKGGAANEPKEFLTCSARSVLPPHKPRKYLGFRYVVIRK
ncbi:MAG: SUMF1/EgtB/PvdO family nonheme iron enzyme [Blastocatellia bacterium]